MRRLRVLIDVDEVLADFQSPTFDIIHSHTGRRFTPSDFEVWDIFEALPTMPEVSHVPGLKDLVCKDIDAKGWCLNLRPFEPAQEAVAKLREFADVYALTSPHHSESWYYERVEWLKKHFGMDKKHVIQTKSKFLVRGDVFIDDNPEHIQAWRAEHPDKMALLWHCENTRKLGFEDIRVRTWSEVFERVNTLR